MPTRFSILDIPGAGAHATVCIARDRDAGAIRALKVLSADYDAESEEAQRVRDEGRILQRLQHRGLPRVHEQLEIDGRQVLVMDFVEGPSLAWLLRRIKRFPADVAVAIAREIADVVDYAYAGTSGPSGHPVRLVHRDLNLANVLLDPEGQVKVLDFGLARAEFLDRESYTLVSLQGTPGYCAPEGLRAIRDNPKLDVYSLGVCLMAMVGGYVPILSRQEARHAEGLEESLTRLEEILAGAHEGLVDLLRGMCAFAPEGRPTMSDVRERLRPDPAALRAFAETTSTPAFRERRQVDPLVHGSYPDLAFLEGIQLGEGAESSPERSDQIVRRFLGRPGWEERLADLKWVLARYPAWTAAPFLEVLARTSGPWWRPGPKVPSRIVGTALAAASHRPCDAVTEAAARLRTHRHPVVAGIASRIVEGEEVPLDLLKNQKWSK
ncbi:MAG: serine/threonine protein kinase [Alphaproteobacteria bacterium]|nr:serine/threonine protein kinase [Alphaproteobacteria bacterium]